MKNLSEYLKLLGQTAKDSSKKMSKTSSKDKQNALNILSKLLRENLDFLQKANQKDLEKAINLSSSMFDRLKLTKEIIETCALGCEQLANQSDIIGEIINLKQQPSGIKVGQMRVPIGVFGMIYESRPNVTIEAASLAIKSSNACILRGGSESFETNKALAELIKQSLIQANLPENLVQLINTTDREVVGHLIKMKDFVDLIIPRGGKGLIKLISNEAKIPVIKHLDGNCHSFVDFPCDINLALKVVENAKTQKYSPCNATESLLIHQKSALEFLPKIAEIFEAKNVEMRVCSKSFEIIEKFNFQKVILATEEDWITEYLAPIISIKIIENVDEAINHINKYSSQHTDAILTKDYENSQKFLREVDSASVMVNSSTRFADGFEYGLGAEIGISTDKFHARGPVGVEGLTSLKFVVLGNGEIRN